MSVLEQLAIIIKRNDETHDLLDQLVSKVLVIFNAAKIKYIPVIENQLKRLAVLNKEIVRFKGMISNKDASTHIDIDIWFNLIATIVEHRLTYRDIYDNLNNIFDKSSNVETLLSQTYIDETVEFHKKIADIYLHIHGDTSLDNIVKVCVETESKKISLMSEPDLLNYINKIQKLFRGNINSQIIYIAILDQILSNISTWMPDSMRTSYTIRSAIEADKNFVLQTESRSKKPHNQVNPYIKTFNLIPMSKSQDISDVCEQIFKQKCKTFNEFVKICDKNHYGLIVMNRIIPNPITYNIKQLIDWNISKEFSDIHKKEYGVNIALLERNKTIDKIAVPKEHNKWKFSIDTYVLTFKDYEAEMGNYVILLDSLANGHYRILCNYISVDRYFVLVSSIKELYHHCAGIIPPSTRTSDVNAIIQNQAMPNIFIPIMINQDKLKDISSVVDPKYLRNNIYLRLNEEFQAQLDREYKGGKHIKDNYTYAKIIHDEKFLCIFSDTITQEFHKFIYNSFDEYKMGHINLSEIFSSFMNTIFIYQRSFVKGIHDYFKDNQIKFNGDITPQIIKNHFNEMSKHVLDKLITADSNIYQTVLYKINILKHSFI